MTRSLPCSALAPACLFALALLPATPALAQPEPSLRAGCGELRQALRRLEGKEGELITIQVEGALTMVRSDGALVYLALCRAPDPQVLCVTYAENGAKIGDRVVASGSYERVGPNHVKLDPCLHHAPGAEPPG
ncbi:hypothetical protein [Bosea sp. (in: a-proteobacteria)]|jgi:hypothetical protein|uniref:hypothetical protein n=1 Tax=Bosea sp. (in: a-proteobacteria) TaxID=1871050 RepID=UPI003F706B51